MSDAKYIVVKINQFETMIVFPNFVMHSDIACTILSNPDDVISAGFIYIDALGGIRCYGESISLNKKSHPEDTRLAMRMFNKGD